WGQSKLRNSSGHPDCPPTDMYLFPVNKTAWHPLGRRIAAISVCVNKAFSRGSVTLRSPDPQARPAVTFELLSDPRDLARMIEGARFALQLLADPQVARHVTAVFHPSGGQANALNRPSRANWVRSWLINAAFDLGGGRLRTIVLGDDVIDPAALAADATALRRAVLEHAAGVHHVSGTCRMGPAGDRAAVTDSRGRVHGVAGLRIGDASLMPTIVRATTHLTVLMIGEKIAAMAAEEQR
ncbi:MAG: GMC oxidoreductase, partial [Lautropia sp.]